MLDAAWLGSVIHDADADLFAVDLVGGAPIELLGRMDRVMFDVAFTPDGQLYGISGPEIPSSLYTIDVDFANPQANISTTLVGAITETGVGAIALNSLGFRSDGTLFGVGFNPTNQEFIYTIDTATAAASAELAIGPHQAAGDLAFDSDGNMFVTTFGGDLLRIDPALSTLEVAGAIGGGDFYGLAYGPAPTLFGFRWWDEFHQVHSIDTDGATTELLAELDHAALHGIYGAATAFQPPTDLGTVDYLLMANQESILEELWYRFDAAHDGILTAEALGLPRGADVQLTLYTQAVDGTLIEQVVDEDPNAFRIDLQAATVGQRYFLRIQGAQTTADVRLTNLVSPGVDSVTTFNSTGADEFVFDTHEDPPGVGAFLRTLTINDVRYEFSFPVIPNLPVFTSTFLGGQGDTATIFDHGGDDDLVAFTDSTVLTGNGYVVDAKMCTRVTVDGSEGGDNMAKLFTSPGEDNFLATPTYARLQGVRTGGAAYTVEMTNFGSVHAYGGGGQDVARLFDSVGNDVFEASPLQGALYGTGYYNRAKNFDGVHAYAGRGNDVATLLDSAGDDIFASNPIQGALYGLGFYNRAKLFESVTARASTEADDHDLAQFVDVDAAGDYETDSYDNVFVGTPTAATMTGEMLNHRALFFEEAVVTGTQGIDIAKLFDSAGDDAFIASPTEATLQGPGYSNQVVNFDAVHAYGSAGKDMAGLSDSPGDDTLWAGPGESALFGVGFYNRAKNFDEVFAEATAGGDGDEAILTDSENIDTLVADGLRVRITVPVADVLYQALMFDRTEATSTTDGDTAEIINWLGGELDLIGWTLI